jgi:phosphatidylserine/phosphatidylglycerophosphate/cardiolipin synthase-like enzyme
MKRLLLALLLLSPLLQAANPYGMSTPIGWGVDLWWDLGPSFEDPRIHLSLCPGEGCTKEAVDRLNGAKRQVLVWASSFTGAPIDRALLDAYKRGVDVQVIMDKSQTSDMFCSATFLTNEGVPTYIDPVHKIAHNTLMVIDEKTVITRSFNLTKSAEKRTLFNFLKSAAQRLFDKPNPFGDCFAGPVLVVHNTPKLAAQSTADWKEHLEHSEPYQAR